jgi:hypothetical protein
MVGIFDTVFLAGNKIVDIMATPGRLELPTL